MRYFGDPTPAARLAAVGLAPPGVGARRTVAVARLVGRRPGVAARVLAPT